MRILIVNYLESLEPGGINKAVRRISYYLSLMGNSVLVFNPARRRGEELSSTTINNNLKIVRGYVGYLYGLNVKNICLVKKLIEEYKPHIIHIHGYHSLFSTSLIILLKRFYKVHRPVVFSPHFDIERSSFAGRYLWKLYNNALGRYVFRLADYIIVHSKYEYKTITNIFAVESSKTSIIPHGVDIIDPRKYMEQNLEQKNKIRLLYVGYLIKRKGVEHVIRALHSLIYKYGVKNVELKIVGKGPEKSRLINLARTLRVNDFITWVDFLPYSKLISELKNADVLLLLSASEAYGIIVAEALALGTPVIITKRTALIEFLEEDGCYGVEYPPNPDKVAETILYIVNNKHGKIHTFKKIKKWSDIAHKYMETYLKILSDKLKGKSRSDGMCLR